MNLVNGEEDFCHIGRFRSRPNCTPQVQTHRAEVIGSKQHQSTNPTQASITGGAAEEDTMSNQIVSSVLTLEQAAYFLSTTVELVKQHIVNGYISAIDCGTDKYLVPASEVERVQKEGFIARNLMPNVIPPNAQILDASQAQHLFQVPREVIDAWLKVGRVLYAVPGVWSPVPKIHNPARTHRPATQQINPQLQALQDATDRGDHAEVARLRAAANAQFEANLRKLTR
jgi:hypothetical protein